MKKSFMYEIEKDIDALPHVDTWTHRPIYLAPGRNTRLRMMTTSQQKEEEAYDHNQDSLHLDDTHLHHPKELPIGQVVPFETDSFQGKLLLRVNGINTSTVPQDHDNYFQGKKRLKQIVLQGRFKQKFSMSDVYFGDVYEKPQKIPKFVAKMILPLFQRMSPGILMDLWSSSDPPPPLPAASAAGTEDGTNGLEPSMDPVPRKEKHKKHKVLTLMAGESRTLSIHHPGEEPDIRSMQEIPEDVALLWGSENPSSNNNNSIVTSKEQAKRIEQRRKKLRNKKIASMYHYDPNLVYTFTFYDDVIDYVHYSVHLNLFGNTSNSSSITSTSNFDGEMDPSTSSSISSSSSSNNFLFWRRKQMKTKTPNSSTSTSRNGICIKETMNGNPFSITVQTGDDVEIIRFYIFHESLVEYKKDHHQRK